MMLSSSHQPPQQARVLPVPQDMLGLVPDIASEIMNQCANNRTMNSVRQEQEFQLSNNNWVNRPMEELIVYVAEAIKLMAVRGQINDNRHSWGNALPDVVNFCLSAMCALMVHQNRRWAQDLTQEALEQMQNIFNRYQALSQEIQNEVRGNTRPGAPANVRAVNNSNSNQNLRSFSSNNNAPRQQESQPANSGNALENNFGSGAGFAAPLLATTEGMSPREVRTRRMLEQSLARQNAGRTSYHQPHHHHQPAPTQAPVAAPPPPDLQWSPIPDDPYWPATNSVTEEVVLIQETKDKKTQVVHLIEKASVSTMEFNRQRHSMTAPVERATSFVPASGATRQSALDTSLKQLTNAVNAAKKAQETKGTAEARREAIEKFARNYSDVPVESTSLEAMIFMTRYLSKKRMGDAAEEVAYRVDGDVVKQLVTLANMDGLMDEIRGASSFSEIVEALIVEQESDDATKETTMFVAKLDMYITKYFNHFLRYNLGISQYVESFMADYNDLVAAVEKSHGDLYKAAIFAAQGKFIVAYLQFVRNNDYVVTETESGAVVTEDSQHEPIVYQSKVSTSVTSIGLFAKELNINVLDGKPCYIRPESNPGLYAFVKAVLDSSAGTLMNHYFVTADDVLYQFTYGAAGEDFYLISVVKN